MSYKNIIIGGLSNINGQSFEDYALKLIVSKVNKDSYIGSQFFLDFPVINKGSLLIYEVKSSEDTKTSIASSEISFSKFFNSSSTIPWDSLKVLVPIKTKNIRAIHLPLGKKDRDFKNIDIGLVSVENVSSFHSYLKIYFLNSFYIDKIKYLLSTMDKKDTTDFEVLFTKDYEKSKWFPLFVKMDYAYGKFSSFEKKILSAATKKYINGADISKREWKEEQIMKMFEEVNYDYK